MARTQKTSRRIALRKAASRKPAGVRLRSLSSAKWIKSPMDHEDRNGQSLATRNHDVIKTWAQERKAKPATVAGTEHGKRPGVLRFDFPDYGGRELEKISWDYWFKSFDSRNLVFQFQEHMKNGRQSNFFKLNSPKREQE